MNDDQISRGTGDFLHDMGYGNPDEMRAKFAIANKIALVIEDSGITEQQAAELMGIREGDVARIENGIVSEFSVDQLRDAMERLESWR
ncbi:helix-turn-helix domain-containing protein [Rhodopseudomonas palustris]|uniref:helix-turn-helix domain-containing protein n=1 Tax=Rhodopseudomonas palustris TaxID=1076 RepID=UPI0021F34EF8|nr:helix-turn-helix domain-containing protein [Rhodopseudomonas palustris]UYO45739.1 helix-turn-helix domain-containing protein [Rhodopseudomonas palustris]